MGILEDVTRQVDQAMDRPVEPGTIDEELMRKVMVPYKLIRSYCRVSIDGLHNLPSGPALLAANHTGWLGLDYTNLAVVLHDKTGRLVRGVVHPAWFANARIGAFANRLGLVEASKSSIVQMLGQGRLVVVFPEAEHGAFKDVRKAKYQLMEFRRGFVRAALEAQKPIVPVAIVGGEEANPTLGTLKLTDRLFRIPLPIPKNILPRPVKWRISLLPPFHMEEFDPEMRNDRDFVHQITQKIQARLQDEVARQVQLRGNAYW